MLVQLMSGKRRNFLAGKRFFRWGARTALWKPASKTCRARTLDNSRAASNDDYVLSDGTCIRAGDRVVNLHVWNEQFPYFTGKGPTLAWARRVNQAFEISLRELAGFLDARSDLDDVIAICANMTFQPAERSAQLTRFVARFGFERIAAASSRSFRQQIHWFGENILISMMVLARNAAALRADTLRRDRMLVFLSRRELRRRYGFAREQAA